MLRDIISIMRLTHIVMRFLIVAALVAAPLIHGALASAATHHGSGSDPTTAAVAAGAQEAASCDDGVHGAMTEGEDEAESQASTCAACFASHCFPSMMGTAEFVLPAGIAGTGCPSPSAATLLEIRITSIEPPRA